jgi:hypothetical protein
MSQHHKRVPFMHERGGMPLLKQCGTGTGETGAKQNTFTRIAQRLKHLRFNTPTFVIRKCVPVGFHSNYLHKPWQTCHDTLQPRVGGYDNLTRITEFTVIVPQ